MQIFQGKPVVAGVAIGTVHVHARGAVTAPATESPEAELSRFEAARSTALEQVIALQKKAAREVGEDEAGIFEFHAIMLEDEEFGSHIGSSITQGRRSAVEAVQAAAAHFAQGFLDLEDEYFRGRAQDVRDIGRRLTDLLCGRTGTEVLSGPCLVFAEDLSPSETVQMDKDHILALVTELGSSLSHTAILARSMNVPSVIGVRPEASWEGLTAVVDGATGEIILDPSAEILADKLAQRQQILDSRAQLDSLKGLADVTLGGREVLVYANIGSASDVDKVLSNDARGIGLFRTEFLFLGRDQAPTEDEQFAVYREVVQRMGGRRVVIRTLDIGADKQAAYFALDPEENPALGLRGIRLCFERTELFRDQLRAILRASAFGKVALMYPMIISVAEVRTILALVDDVKAELSARGQAYGEFEQGVMIETPAAVVMSDELAQEVDFFSIGTNDLTQYTLAIDRQNSKLDRFYDPRHPAILRMIRTVVDNGHAAGCWVGICGELAAFPDLTEAFLAMGVDELSVSASMVLPLRQRVRQSTVR